VSQGQVSHTIGSGIAVYGSGLYGTAQYGGSGRRKAYTELPLGAEGRTVTNKNIYTGQERFRVFTYTYTILPEPRPRTFSE
jgi:hypothetical protein